MSTLWSPVLQMTAACQDHKHTLVPGKMSACRERAGGRVRPLDKGCMFLLSLT